MIEVKSQSKSEEDQALCVVQHSHVMKSRKPQADDAARKYPDSRCNSTYFVFDCTRRTVRSHAGLRFERQASSDECGVRRSSDLPVDAIHT